jgi:hypothetical protein
MVDRRLLVVSDCVINYTKVYVCQELTRHIGYFLMLHVVLNRIVVVYWVNLS